LRAGFWQTLIKLPKKRLANDYGSLISAFASSYKSLHSICAQGFGEP
jgi:hypothetical protein